MMKEAIAKAVKNGFDISSAMFKDKRLKVGEISYHDTWFNVTSVGKVGTFPKVHETASMDYYHLIFGTDLIECLVGEGEMCINYPNKDCCERLCGYVDYDIGKINCSKKISYADYHRSIMANIKDIEKLKEHVRKLI